MKTVRILTILGLAVLLTACCSCRRGGKNSKSFTGTQWSLIEMAGSAVTAGDGYQLTFNGDENRFSGVGDCNRISGAYSLKTDQGVQLSSVVSTRMLCANQAQENQFLKMIEQVDGYRIDNDLLMLMRGEEVLGIMQAK